MKLTIHDLLKKVRRKKLLKNSNKLKVLLVNNRVEKQVMNKEEK
jgi:hypothetical protein